MSATIDHGTTIWDAMQSACNQYPYYAPALGRLRLVATPGLGTMATSAHWVTHYDPATVAGWTAPEAGAVLVHELEHLLRRHHDRCGDRDPQHFNVAGDAEINQRLGGLPEGAVYPESLGMPRGLTAEAYYAATGGGRKAQDPEGDPGEGEGEGDPGQGSGESGGESGEGAGQGSGSEAGEGAPGQGSGGSGEGSGGQGPAQCGSAAGGPLQDHETGDAALGRELSEDEVAAARKAAANAILREVAPGTEAADELRTWAEIEIGLDRSAWYRALATVIGSSMSTVGAPSRWSWSPRRDPRDMAGAVLPRWTGERPRAAVVIDTSGSITPEDLNLARTAALYLGKFADVTYYGCSTYAYPLGRTLPDTLTGMGGTRMDAGIEMAIADGARAVVVITDCINNWDRTAAESRPVPVIIGANMGARRIIETGPEGRYYPPETYRVVPVIPAERDR